ncbi:hypothetical protein AA0Z99_02220 [Agrococcus sp. 1P02AA]|uniref:hypothetical protein n=1 Tax=Agrococcus sp. 1P02AA TaxID=3132259 RepID=UPI0039A5CDF7
MSEQHEQTHDDRSGQTGPDGAMGGDYGDPGEAESLAGQPVEETGADDNEPASGEAPQEPTDR